MNALVSSFVKKVQSNHCENLKRRTQKLDRVDQENLLDFLEDHLPSSTDTGTRKEKRNDELQRSDMAGDIESNQIRTTASIGTNDVGGAEEDSLDDDYELLQRDLDRANTKLEQLQTKRDFLHTRLQTYRSKIKVAEESMSQNAKIHEYESSENEEICEKRLVAMKEKIEGYKTSLEPIQDIYDHIESELLTHRLMIESLQDRQFELKVKTEECRIVLHELATSAETNMISDERNNVETDECDGLIGTIGNAEDCSTCDDELHSSENDSDVENAKDEEAAIQKEMDETERKNPIEKSTTSRVIPAGGHLEIEQKQEEK